jgi:Tfp pilus assembly protein PilN
MDMIQINLLPKEFRKKTGKLSIGKGGYYGMAAVTGVILMIVVVTFYQVFQIRQLDENMEIARFRTQQLQKDIAVVDALIDVKQKIMQRMEAVERLDQHRSVWVRILEDFSRQVPDFMWLSALREGQVVAVAPTDSTAAEVVQPVQISTKPVTIEGFSFTLNSLANLMIKLMRSHFFSDVEMASVEEVMFQQQKVYSYEVTATLHYLSDEDLKELLEKESGPDLLASF